MSRSCIFCGADGATAEHVLPEWISRHLKRVYGNEAFVVRGPRFTQDTSLPLAAEPRTVDSVDLRVRRVCQPCNTIWMSNLETQAKPWLQPMVEGRVVQIAGDTQAILARWAIKTVMCLEFVSTVQHAHPDDRLAIREGAIPDGYSVFAASYFSPEGVHGCFAYSPLFVRNEDGDTTTALAATVLIDHVVLQVIGSGRSATG